MMYKHEKQLGDVAPRLIASDVSDLSRAVEALENAGMPIAWSSDSPFRVSSSEPVLPINLSPNGGVAYWVKGGSGRLQTIDGKGKRPSQIDIRTGDVVTVPTEDEIVWGRFIDKDPETPLEVVTLLDEEEILTRENESRDSYAIGALGRRAIDAQLGKKSRKLTKRIKKL